MKIARKKSWRQITNAMIAFCLALSSVTASVPFISSQKAGAIASADSVYDALPSTSPATNYPSQAFQATSTSEFGDYIHLGGSNRVVDKVTVTMSNWAKYADYSSNPAYSGNDATWSLPITINVYDNQFDANGTPTHKIASVTQTQSIPWRPASDPTCGATSNGTGWKTDGVCYNFSGIASNVVFDLSNLHVTLPDDIVVSVAYNTQTHGYAPTGVAGPYDSLNVAVPVNQPVAIGSDDNDMALVNSTWSGAYGDGGSTGVFRKTFDWSPYGTVAMKVTAKPANTAPSVVFADPTPAADSYVHGMITPHVLASDDYGMGSYYIRLWKNAFESGSANLVSNNCSSAPGAYLLGTAQDSTCPSIDTTALADGKYVLSAQFLDGENLWGSALRTFYVDNTNPKISIKTGTGANDGTIGKDGVYSRISFKLNDPNGGLSKVVLNGNEYTRTNEWNDLNWVNIIKSQLIEGTNTVYAVDRAGNQSTALTFIYDKTAPTVTVKDGYVGNLASKIFSNVSFKLFDQQKVDKYVINGSTSDFTDNQWSDANFQNIVSRLNQGANTFTLYDIAGNSTTYEFTYDSVAPTVPVHEFPANNAVINFNDFWFEWADVAGAVKYETQYSQNPAVGSDGAFQTVNWTGDYQQIQPTDSKAHSVGANGTWYWQVRSVDAAGNKSAWSTPWKVTIDMDAPIVPTLVSPSDGAVVNGTSITQSWMGTSSDIDHYIYESYNDAAATSLRFSSSYTGTSKTATNVADAVYWWRVKAVDAAGNTSAWSPLWKITVDNTPPSFMLNSVDSNSDTSRTISGTTDPFAEVTITVHSTPQTKTTTADADGRWSIVFSDLESGPHTVNATSKDLAGNVTPITTKNFEVTTASVTSSSQNQVNTISRSTVASPAQDQSLLAFTPGVADDSVAVNDTTENDGEVLSAQNSKKNVAVDSTSKQSGDSSAVNWYWLFAVLALIAMMGWLILAARRRRSES